MTTATGNPSPSQEATASAAVAVPTAHTDSEEARRLMSVAYRKTHSGAYRVRWDAYDLATLYLMTGRPKCATPKRIHAQINGGRCAIGPVRTAIADARRDCVAMAARQGEGTSHA